MDTDIIAIVRLLHLHTRKFPFAGQISKWALRRTTVANLIGIYQFNTNDVGTIFCIVSLNLFTSLLCSGLTEFIAKAQTA